MWGGVGCVSHFLLENHVKAKNPLFLKVLTRKYFCLTLKIIKITRTFQE